jgi:hypothetical protein
VTTTDKTGTMSRPQGRRAAGTATHRNTLHVTMPVLGQITLPPANQLAFLGGLGALVALGVLEWPVGAVLGVGHLLAADHNHKILADFGEALEEA